MGAPFTLEEVSSWERKEEVQCPIAHCSANHKVFRRENPDKNGEIAEVQTFEDDLDNDVFGVYAYIFTGKSGERRMVKYCAFHQMLEMVVLDKKDLKE